MTVTEHTHEITLTGIKVYLPVRQYEVTIKHRLLDQLGIFSRIILEALHDFEQVGYELICSITGLTRQQLEPIICRLEGLGLIRNGAITAKGKDMVKIYNHIHRQSRLVWLDGRYVPKEGASSYYGDDSLSIIPIDVGQAFVLKSWSKGSWPKPDWNEDRAFQLKRLLDQPMEYFPSLFEGFSYCMAGAENRMNLADWEVDVRIIPEFAKAAFAVEAVIDTAALLPASNSDTHFNFSSPVIALRTIYSAPQNVPLGMVTNKPEDKFNVIGLLNTGIDTALISRDAASDWTWPDLDTAEHEQVIYKLFCNFQDSATSVESFFNRYHQIETWWQPMSFSREAVDAALSETGLRKVNNLRMRR